MKKFELLNTYILGTLQYLFGENIIKFDFNSKNVIIYKDGDGTISSNELGTVMRSLGHNPSEADLQDMINQYDNDGNGIIDFEEFLIMMSKAMDQVNTEEEFRIAFRVFDKNKQGDIPADELRNVFDYLRKEKLLGISEDECEGLLRKWDKDGDGDVDYKGNE